MKINKVEVEMTKAEKVVFDIVKGSDPCTGVDCMLCPLSVDNISEGYSSACLFKNLDCVEIKVTREPVTLSEGMDVKRLTTRDGTYEVLGVWDDVTDTVYTYYVLLRDRRCKKFREELFTVDGSYCVDELGNLDLVWKEDV